jgi:signal transduction histidine kinase
LILIVLVAILPVLVFSGVLAKQLIRSKYEANSRLLTRTADELAFAADQEISSTIRTLQGLSQSSALKSGHLKIFHQELEDMLSTQPSWGTLVLHDTEAHWLLAARQPYSIKLGQAFEPDSIFAVTQTGQPQIGKIFPVHPSLKMKSQFGFAVRVPVTNQDGKIIYVLSAILGSRSMQDLVSRFTTNPGEWVRSIVDRNGVIAARSREPDKYVGETASEQMRSLLSANESGFERTITLDQVPVYTAFRKAPLSGWHSIVAVRADVLETDARKAQNGLIIISVFMLALSGLITLIFSHWIRRALKSGADGAAVVARGRTPTLEPSPIIELEELRQSLLAASELLRSRDRAKSDFLANMSHEIRTPLGIVLGMTELIGSEKVTAYERERMSEIVKRNGQQLLRLIDDILDLAKIETNRLPIEHIDFSLPDLISSVTEDLSARAQENGVKLQIVFEKGSPNIVNSDPIRLRQIIFNLVGNAVKFTHQGTIEVRLHETKDEFARLTVSDSGIGIKPEQQSLLFSNFAQGDTSHSRKYGGAGLGLSLSRKLARLLDGDVNLLRSELNQGSVFEVYFKMRPLSKEAALPVKVESRIPAVIETNALKKILLAEDSSDNVALIQMYLKNSKAQVSVVSNGVDALKLAMSETFDLILMDIQMPEMDGYEATQQIRQQGIATPIVALTAHALDAHRERALQSGFDDFVTKPVRRGDLIDTLSKHLQITI